MNTFIQKQGFDMNTGNSLKKQHATNHITNEENSSIPVNLLKNTGNIGGKIKPRDEERTRLQELSLMNNHYFSAIHFDIHLHTKLGYTINRNVQKIVLSEL